MFINKLIASFLFVFSITFSQTKKVSDTVYVYEKVFVYKTKLKKDTLNNRKEISVLDTAFRKKIGKIRTSSDSFAIPSNILDSSKLIVKGKIVTYKQKTTFLSIYNYGVFGQTLFSQQTESQNYGFGGGIFITKNIFQNKFFADLEFSYSEVFATTSQNSFTGYYITPNAVLFYKPNNIKTQQIAIPVIFYWSFGKLKPIIGLAFVSKQTQLDFYSYPNNTTFTQIQEETHKLTNHYLDIIYGLKYDYSKRIACFLRAKYSFKNINSLNTNIENINSLESLQFFPNQVSFGIVYKLKKK